MGLSYFWFITAAIIGAMDLYFGNLLLLVLSVAAFFTALLSFFVSSVYIQVGVFTALSLAVLAFIAKLASHKEKADFYSNSLRRYIGQSVTVHEWRNNRSALVHFNGKVWKAEIAFNPGVVLNAGRYTIWKILPDRLILIRTPQARKEGSEPA